MILAALSFFDYVMIAVIVAIFAGGSTIASRRAGSTAAAGERLRRMEEKLNLLLSERGMSYSPRAMEQWQELAAANDASAAIQEYSTEYSVSTDEAEDVVNQFIADLRDSG